MANHIHKLEDELSEAQEELRGLREGLQDLRRYLTTPKFHEDPTVQVRDVLNRLQDAHNLGAEYGWEKEMRNRDAREDQAITAAKAKQEKKINRVENWYNAYLERNRTQI